MRLIVSQQSPCTERKSPRCNRSHITVVHSCLSPVVRLCLLKSAL